MTWTKLDDQAWKNERLLALSMAARLLWFLALSFVGEGWPDNDGTIGVAQAAALAAMHGVKKAAIAELVELGRWEKVDSDRYHVHDIEKFMPPKDLSEKRSRAGKAGAAVSNSNRPANAEALAQHVPSKVAAQGTRIPIPVARVKSPDGESSSRHKAESDKPLVDLSEVTESWNSNCAPLATLRKPPAGDAKLRLVRRAIEYFDGDLEAFGAAVRRYAANPFIRENRYGLETLCRHIERWSEDVAHSEPENPIDRRIREASERGRGDVVSAGTVIDLHRAVADDTSWIPRSLMAPPG
ncbi:MAG: hypothetical protein WB807_03080 [Candidatus Dormiibacterota bacterium]